MLGVLRLLHTMCTSLLRAAGSRLRPQRYLITIQFAASGAGSSRPLLLLFGSVLWRSLFFSGARSRCHVSRLGDPPALPLKDDLGLGSMPGAQAEGESRDSPSQPGLNPRLPLLPRDSRRSLRAPGPYFSIRDAG